MTIIDSTYFDKLEAFVPNNKSLSVEPVGSPTVQSELDAFIDKYERELFLELGTNFYNGLQTAIADLLNADQKWIDLVDGKDYTIGTNNYRWDGLKGYKKQSLIAFYVYCQYMRTKELTFTTTGVVRNESANATNATHITKFVQSWDEFLDKYQKGYSESCTNVKRSLIQYLNDANTLDATAFPDFSFKIYKPYNRWGI